MLQLSACARLVSIQYPEHNYEARRELIHCLQSEFLLLRSTESAVERNAKRYNGASTDKEG